MKTLPEILPVIGASAHDVDNWMRQLELSTTYQPTARGRSRLYSRDNVLELAFIAAFTRAGIRALHAAAHAATQLRAVNYGGFRDWIVFVAGDASKGSMFNIEDATTILQNYAKEAIPGAISLIPAREIRNRVDALFAEAN